MDNIIRACNVFYKYAEELLAKPSKHDAAINKIKKEIDRLAEKSPTRLTKLRWFFEELADALRAKTLDREPDLALLYRQKYAPNELVASDFDLLARYTRSLTGY